MAGFAGSDVDQLDALAHEFDRKAGALREIASSSTVALMVAEWTGGDIERVRSEWNRSARPSILRAAEDLAQSAIELRKKADLQRDVSAVRWSETHRVDPSPGPANTGDLVRGISDMTDKQDGLRIEKVVGPDGVTRMVVYFAGTGSASGGLFDVEENGAASLNLPTDTRDYLMRRIREAVVDDPDIEMMIVGHSQGGMLAEAIADSGEFNVKEVVTVGAPGIAPAHGFGGAHVTRLQHWSDPVVNGTALARGSVLDNLGQLLGAANGAQTFRAGNPLEGLVDLRGAPRVFDISHGLEQGDYGWLAGEYDKSTDPGIVEARERQAVFLGGTVVADEK